MVVMFGGGKGLKKEEEKKKEEINLKLLKIKGFASVLGGGECQASYTYIHTHICGTHF